MPILNQVLETVARQLQQGQDKSREQFLAGSQDAADLERRVAVHDRQSPALRSMLMQMQQS